MSVILKDKEYAIPEEGLHDALCIDVEPIFDEPRSAEFGGGIQSKTRVVWALASVDDATGKQFVVSKKYTVSMHEKGNLAKDLTSWRGRPFNPAERQGFDLENLVLVPCRLLIVHNTSKTNGKTYANVEKVMKAEPGKPKVTLPAWFTRKKDRADYKPNYGTTAGYSDKPSTLDDAESVPF